MSRYMLRRSSFCQFRDFQVITAEASWLMVHTGAVCLLLLSQITRKFTKRGSSFCCEFTSFEHREPLMERVFGHRIVGLLDIRAKIPSFESKRAHSSRKLPITHLRGNWAECSTESASIIGFWVQGSIKPNLRGSYCSGSRRCQRTNGNPYCVFFIEK